MLMVACLEMTSGERGVNFEWSIAVAMVDDDMSYDYEACLISLCSSESLMIDSDADADASVGSGLSLMRS
jgi:hypothetical protein